jgi:hypothetical protein
MTSKKETKKLGVKPKFTVLGNKESKISKRNEEAIRILKRIRGKLG